MRHSAAEMLEDREGDLKDVLKGHPSHKGLKRGRKMQGTGTRAEGGRSVNVGKIIGN